MQNFHSTNDCILRILRGLTIYCDWSILNQLNGFLEQNIYIIVETIYKTKYKHFLPINAEAMRESKSILNYYKESLLNDLGEIVFKDQKHDLKKITNSDVLNDIKICFAIFNKIGAKHLNYKNFKFYFNDKDFLEISHIKFSSIPDEKEFKKEAKIFKVKNNFKYLGHAQNYIARTYGFNDFNAYKASEKQYKIKNYDK